ncbi:formin-E [Nothobranchius furzeri]|uniref:Formin-E-like n=3 Tax=Nothobranchius TaxID=28779 RepID=A0A8C6NLH3_NOTFU|nr:formin-E [Nothobranchius furzeri]KAF7209212.1 formin-E-like [Nothobranchius furzeri]
MPSLGLKKKDNLSRTEDPTRRFPQLSNEMQLSIMKKVKNGEMSIEAALDEARKEREQLCKEQPPPQYNFSVHKHSRYRWQKRVLQIDFKTKMLCSIERGIIKRQLPFSVVKSCDDGVGSRFSISFKGHHDYELEATSMEDKHKMMELVNQIIYGNIYSEPADNSAARDVKPQAPQSLCEGILLLHRGGLASLKWVKYQVQLHPGQLTMVPFRQRRSSDGDVISSDPFSTVIHLSDGGTSVQKPNEPDMFTLVTHKNKYQFKVPAPDEGPGSVQKERDAWVQALDNLCSEWKRKSRCEYGLAETMPVKSASTTEDSNENNTGLDSSGEFGGSIFYALASNREDGSSADDASQNNPSSETKPFPKRCSNTAPHAGSDDSPTPPIQSPTSPSKSSPSPSFPPPLPLAGSSLIPEPQESGFSAMNVPPPPNIPAPPPIPMKLRNSLKKLRTKAFHWDLISSEKITKSFWIPEKPSRIEINTIRLLEQFAVKDIGALGVVEQSSSQHILLNPKIAHNFNIFLKSFPVKPEELKDKLFIINEEDGGLSDEHITSLRRYVPTMDDVEMYKSHKGAVTELHIVDRYMMEMCNIPYLSMQLDLLLALRELPISMSDLQPLINQKVRLCQQLYNSRSFVSVLEYLLAMGNYLNENAGKEKAKGFRLSSLTKLSQLRGSDKNFTLLHALVEQIMLHQPGLAVFTEELAEFETIPGASIKGLTAEVDVLKNELQKIVQSGKTFKKKNIAANHPHFSKDLKMAIEKYNTDQNCLMKTCEEMKKLYSVILVKFGEPADQDSQEFFGLISQFVLDFRRAHAEMV